MHKDEFARVSRTEILDGEGSSIVAKLKEKR